MLVSFFVSSPDTHSERRFDSDLTVGQLKDKLVPITGIAQQHQVLRLFRSSEAAENNEVPVAIMNDDSATLAACGLQEFACVKVDNTDPNFRPGEFSDLTAVDKFELTKDEYESRNDTVHSHLKANKLGRFADVPVPIAFTPPPPACAPSSVTVGARCEVRNEGALPRRGTVRFVGEADIARGGVWVGVELDEPTGNGDGSVEGKRYFTCLAKHAVFTRPDKIVVGDFPEEDLFADDNEDEI